MLNILYNIILLLFGSYLVYTGNVAKKLIGEEDDTENKLFISLMVCGSLIILFSIYSIYSSFSNV
tara:strand:+ start:1241 stop:1435 length:195 start_codon:yes stop_codon:yes gene_type:complete